MSATFEGGTLVNCCFWQDCHEALPAALERIPTGPWESQAHCKLWSQLDRHRSARSQSHHAGDPHDRRHMLETEEGLSAKLNARAILTGICIAL